MSYLASVTGRLGRVRRTRTTGHPHLRSLRQRARSIVAIVTDSPQPDTAPVAVRRVVATVKLASSIWAELAAVGDQDAREPAPRIQISGNAENLSLHVSLCGGQHRPAHPPPPGAISESAVHVAGYGTAGPGHRCLTTTSKPSA
jgi:hypothetical protein